MERKEELEEFIKDYRQKRKSDKEINISEIVKRLYPLFRDKLNFLVNDQIQKQAEDNDNKLKFVFLCRLLSSSYTGSNEVILGMSNSMLYLDEKKSLVYWTPELIYKDIDKDLKEAENILRKKFTRLQEAELIYIKRKLLDDDWKLLQGCFCTMSKRCLNLIMDSQLKLEDELLFLCGNYMDSLKVIYCAGEGENNE